MPYVRRKPDGSLESLHRDDPGGCAFVPNADPELQAFIGNVDPASDFARLDADFVRVIEDLIDALIVKNIINLTDLPDQAQAKLLARKSFRERRPQNSLRLFESSEYGDVI